MILGLKQGNNFLKIKKINYSIKIQRLCKNQNTVPSKCNVICM